MHSNTACGFDGVRYFVDKYSLMCFFNTFSSNYQVLWKLTNNNGKRRFKTHLWFENEPGPLVWTLCWDFRLHWVCVMLCNPRWDTWLCRCLQTHLPETSAPLRWGQSADGKTSRCQLGGLFQLLYTISRHTTCSHSVNQIWRILTFQWALIQLWNLA